MLAETQSEGLRERFPLFDPDRCDVLFSSEQRGTARVAGQGTFPAVKMANGVQWFYDRANRPLGGADARGERRPMKCKAPKGARHLIADTLDPPELLLVEGEGDAVALVSVGYRGVVIGGGTNALTSKAGAQHRANVLPRAADPG